MSKTNPYYVLNGENMGSAANIEKQVEEMNRFESLNASAFLKADQANSTTKAIRGNAALNEAGILRLKG